MDHVQVLASPAPRPTLRLVWAAVRLLTSVALLIAIVAQVVHTVQYASEQGWHLLTVIANHFSYFTVLSTTAGAVLLTVSGLWLLRHRNTAALEPRWVSVLMLCIGAAMVITGIVYNLLLRGGAPDPDTLGWASEIKHVVAPLVFAIDLVLHVARAPYRWVDAAATLVYPIVWAGYTLLRGELITNPQTGEHWWYPYGFLDPHRNPGGYWGVALYVVGIAAALALIAVLSVWVSRRRGRVIS